MESHEVVRQALTKGNPKEAAAELGISLSLIYKWAQSNPATPNPLDRVALLYALTQDDYVLQWLCLKGGGVFVKNPPSQCQKGFEVMPATQEIVQQFANLLSSISHAALDSSITPQEAHSIRHVWDELKRYTEGFVRCCEEEDFVHLTKELKTANLH